MEEIRRKQKTKKYIFYDLDSVQKIQTRPQESLDLWATHLKSPTAALAHTLERTYRAKMWDGIICNEPIVKSEALGSFSSLAFASCVNKHAGHVVF